MAYAVMPSSCDIVVSLFGPRVALLKLQVSPFESCRQAHKKRQGGTHDVPRLRSFSTVTRHMCAKVRPQAMSFSKHFSRADGTHDELWVHLVSMLRQFGRGHCEGVWRWYRIQETVGAKFAAVSRAVGSKSKSLPSRSLPLSMFHV
jgi:hypothetical protein